MFFADISASMQPARFIAETNHNLERRIRDGKFRLDLYHRLNEIPIELPPLTDRKEDIPGLVGYFLRLRDSNFDGNHLTESFKTLCNLLSKRNWPGNVRQLKAEVDRLYHLAEGNLKTMVSLVEDDSDGGSPQEELVGALEETNWNQREAARILNITEGGVRYRIKKYNLKKDDSA